MEQDANLTRRNWLCSSAMMLGAVGIAGWPEKSVAAAAAPPDASDLGVFNVLAFGATGDGITDDADAIQNAINAAQNYSRGHADKGGLVYLPAGAYCVSKTLLITQAVKIFGRGQATIDGATHIIPASLDFDVFKIINVNWGVVLEGFLIKAYANYGGGGHFLRIQACQHVRIREVHLINCWNGALVDSSGDVFFHDLNISAADVPGKGRYGIKCTAASKGNPNAAQAINCTVSQWGQNVRTMDGFVLADGYNSFSTINSGALNCNRAFWSTSDGGNPPNFFVISLGCSDHCNTAIALDDGSFTQVSEMVVTSAYIDNINVGENITGPVSFSNCAIFTTGGNHPPQGAGYRIFSAKSPSVSIVGGSVRDTAGHAIDISGNASVLITGVAISAIQSGKNADGVRISGSGHLNLTGLSITRIKHIAIRVAPEFTGTLTFSGIHQHDAQRGLFDEGSEGTIQGTGCFHNNAVMDVDISKNRNAQTCIQTPGSVPWPFNPTPDVPGSGVLIRNSTGTNCMVYLSRGHIHNVSVDGVELGAANAIYLPVDRSIAIHYSGDLSWTWQRMA